MSEKINDIIGCKFGKLTVIEFVGKDNNRHKIYKCACECGNIRNVRIDKLKSGSTVSCGCRIVKHGKRYERIYSIWCGMKQRCYNMKNEHYRFYGAKGVTICKEWINDFMNFYNWSIKNGYSDDLTIDRINPFGNYEPNNCRWATNKEQQQNKRNNYK